MAFLFGAFYDPLRQQFFLLRVENFVGGGGRHLERASGLDALDDEGFLRITGRDGRAGAAGFDGLVAEVESEAGHPGAVIRPVATEAGIGEDGADVAVEAYFGEEGDDREEKAEEPHGKTMR